MTGPYEGKMKKPRILIIAPTLSEKGLGLFYKQAFQTLGYEVEMTGALQLVQRTSRAGRGLNRLKTTSLLKKYTHKASFAALLKFAGAFRPEIIVTIRCEMLNLETVEELTRISGGRHFNIYPDSPIQIPGIGRALELDAMRGYSAVLTFSKASVPVFYQLGARQAYWLPFGYARGVHAPSAQSVQDLGVSYFGTWGPAPEYWLKKASELDIYVFGHGWERLPLNSQLRARWAKDLGTLSSMSEMISKSRIIFNLIRPEHGCAHSMKTFEIPASGGFMLTNWTEEQASFFTPDKEAVYFNCTEELVDKARFFLSNESARAKIAAAGHTACIPHDYEDRARRILTLADSGSWTDI